LGELGGASYSQSFFIAKIQTVSSGSVEILLPSLASLSSVRKIRFGAQLGLLGVILFVLSVYVLRLTYL